MTVPDPPAPGLAAEESRVVVCDARDLGRVDVGTVDTLARLALEARRRGRELRLCQPSTELRNLIALAGLAEVLLGPTGSAVEARRETEHREELLGVQEEGDAADPTA